MTGDAFRSTFREHKDTLYRFAWRMSGSAEVAQDVVQDCFVELLRHPSRFDNGRGTIRAYLLGIARNRVRQHWRDEHHWDSLDEDSFVAPVLDPARRETSELVLESHRCVDGLAFVPQGTPTNNTETDAGGRQAVARVG